MQLDYLFQAKLPFAIHTVPALAWFSKTVLVLMYRFLGKCLTSKFDAPSVAV